MQLASWYVHKGSIVARVRKYEYTLILKNGGDSKHAGRRDGVINIPPCAQAG